MACLCCCCRLPEKEEKKPLIVDVNQILCDEAWLTFKSSLGYFQRKCIKRSNFKIDVPENYFSFDPVGLPSYEPIDQTLAGFQTHTGLSVTSPDQNGKKNDVITTSSNGDRKEVVVGGIKVTTKEMTPDEAISLDTTFNNDTAEIQTYQFKFSKQRTTKVEVSYQKGFTIGGKANFSIGLPKSLASAKLGFAAEHKYEIKKSRGQTFEESMTMEATSDIHVGPKSRYVAKVMLEERSIHAKFTVRIRMSMPQKRAPIYVRRRSDDVVVFVYNVRHLADVFFGDQSEASDVSTRFPSVHKVRDGEKLLPEKVDFVVEGVVKGNLDCDHTINLTSNETEDEKTIAKNKRFQE